MGMPRCRRCSEQDAEGVESMKNGMVKQYPLPQLTKMYGKAPQDSQFGQGLGSAMTDIEFCKI